MSKNMRLIKLANVSYVITIDLSALLFLITFWTVSEEFGRTNAAIQKMLVAVFSITVICLLLWVYLSWKNVSQYWAKLGVPHLPPHYLLGSLTFLQQKNFNLWLIDTYRHFRTPFVGIWLFWKPALIINSPKLSRNILIRDFTNFRNRLVKPGSFDPMTHNLFTVDDPMWSLIRRNLTSIFTSSKLKALQSLFDKKADQLVQRIKNTEDASKLDIRLLLTDYTTDLIATAGFGVDTTATLTGEDPIRTVTKSFMSFDWYKGLRWSTIFFCPTLAELLRFSVFPQSTIDFFKKIFDTVIEQRRKHGKNVKESKDLVDTLLKLKDHGIENNNEISDVDIMAQAIVFLFGGYETSGSVLSFILYELAFQPQIQEKLYAELLEAKKNNPNGLLDINIQADLIYLNCVIKEALRKYPPLGGLDRVALSDYKVDETLTIPAGTAIYVNVVGMQYDGELFPEPETFNPDRFLPENEQQMDPFTYMPFGDGPRNCIGKRFAQISLRNALSYLVLNFNFKPIPKAPKPSEVKVEIQHIFLVPGEELHINFEKRIKLSTL